MYRITPFNQYLFLLAGHYRFSLRLLLGITAVVFSFSACGTQNSASDTATVETTLSCDLKKDLSGSLDKIPKLSWQSLREACQSEIISYQHQDPVGYSWFTNAANGFAGTPLLILKALPNLAPEIWGPEQENFAKFGLFPDPDQPDRVLPRGLGIASKNGRPLDLNKFPSGEIDYSKPDLYITTFACGACHTGRVKVGAKYQILEGAPNTQFDVRSWRQAFIDTRQRYLSSTQIGTKEAPGETTEKILSFIASQEAGHFARGLPLLPEKDVITVDAQQRAIVKANIIPILNGVALGIRASDWMIKLQTHQGSSYGHKGLSPGLAGYSSGQSDGSGDLLAQLTAINANFDPNMTEAQFLKTAHPVVPPFATVTDIPSVWNQQQRSAAQWDGSVSMGFWRNIAAQLPIVGDPKAVDLNNTHIVDKFLHQLPPAPYPFDVDLKRAAKGQVLFEENCAGCHRPNNSRPYWEMQTDFNRAQVLNEGARNLFLSAFTAACHDKEYSYVDATGKTITPCTMDGTKIIRDTTVVDAQGYMANVLDGIWARAPYLHNGSIPTLRHLLVPAERPAQFLRGVEEYDQDSVGWVWQLERKNEFQTLPTLMVYDTRRDGLSNFGHDKDIKIEGKVYRLNWSDSSQEQDLANLLEFMKTL